jgi:DNA-binding XRE family transcriptional regulator
MINYSFHAFDGIELEDGFCKLDTPYGAATVVEQQEALELLITKTFIFKEDGISGAQLRAIRRALDLTQEALGAILGVERKTIVRWENETSAVSKSEAFAVRMLAADSFLDAGARSSLSIRGERAFPQKLHFYFGANQWRVREFPQLNANMNVVSVPSNAIQKTPFQYYFIDPSVQFSSPVFVSNLHLDFSGVILGYWQEGVGVPSELDTALAAMGKSDIDIRNLVPTKVPIAEPEFSPFTHYPPALPGPRTLN